MATNYDILSLITNSLYSKVTIPSDFHSQARCVKEMLKNDVSGLVGSLTDFQVNAANVQWLVRTGNDTLDSIMKEWLDTINSSFNGKIPSGIQALATEYYKERWKGSSFPVLKIMEWGEINGFQVPVKMAFVDGASIYLDTANKSEEFVDLGEEKYYLGSKFSDEYKLNEGCIFTKPFGRWIDEYPPIYLIKNGVYYNWKLEQSLLSKTSEILDQVIPYMLLVKKGSESLMKEGHTYDEAQLRQVGDQIKELIQKTQEFKYDKKRTNKSGIRVSQFDEDITHFIPDLKTILAQELHVGFEKRQLAGLGFMDIADAVSSSRRESVLNPKAFIQETNTGIGDAKSGSGFAGVLKEVLVQIKLRNAKRPKFSNTEMRVLHSKPQIFMASEFRTFLMSLYNRGVLSKKTLVEVAGDEVYDEQNDERKREAKRGDEFFMYPPVTQNQESQGDNDYLGSKNKNAEADLTVPEEKRNADTKQKYNLNNASIEHLEFAVYKSVNNLPDAVKEAIPSKKLQRKWLRIWNSAYSYALGKYEDKKKAEIYAFKVAYSKTPRENNKVN